jgi:ribosomal protein S18 acetylase RimI-like enzyme
MTNNDPSISFVYKENTSHEEYQTVKEGIIEEAVKANMGRMTSYAILIKDSKSITLGGSIGYTMYGMLYIDMLWIHPKHRNKGWGVELLKATEKLGKERKCRFSCLFTMSWQALPFYEKMNYELEYTRKGFDNDAELYMLRKSI